jgi:hypothetical protein
MEISKNKQNVKRAYDLGYRISNNICYDPNNHILKGYNRKGYMIYGQPVFFGHFMVAYQKYGNDWLYGNLIIRHLDGNSLNNQDSNILLGTYKDNSDDISIERRKIRSKNVSASKRNVPNKLLRKFSNDLVLSIRKDYYIESMKQLHIAEKYKIHVGSVNKLIKMITYKDVIDDELSVAINNINYMILEDRVQRLTDRDITHIREMYKIDNNTKNIKLHYKLTTEEIYSITHYRNNKYN